MFYMEYIKFSLRIPRPACDYLDAEAASDGRNRTQMIIKILKDRYGMVAPVDIVSRSRDSPRAKAKVKQKAKAATN